MGILDDAIKEHLELKRAHGAPEDEVRQKEAEAFGPIRHDAAPAPAEAPQMPAAALEEPDPETALYEDAATEYEPVADPEPVSESEPAHTPAAEDPYVVHPGDEPVPDPHAHDESPVGSDPAYREDTEIFSEPPAPAPSVQHHDEPHPALHEHDDLRGEVHPPEPVFQPAAEAPPAPTEPEPAPIEDPPVGDPPVEHPEIDEPPPRQAPPEPEADVELGDEDVLEETPEFLQDAPEHDRLWFEQRPPRDFDFGE